MKWLRAALLGRVGGENASFYSIGLAAIGLLLTGWIIRYGNQLH